MITAEYLIPVMAIVFMVTNLLGAAFTIRHLLRLDAVRSRDGRSGCDISAPLHATQARHARLRRLRVIIGRVFGVGIVATAVTALTQFFRR